MGGRLKASRAPISLLLASVCISLCAIAVSAQQASSPQPLNANVSDFGTTFVFSPPPVCPGCLETELGFQSVDDARVIPAIATWALPSGHTDLSVLVNLLDSESSQRDRLTQFGNRFDFVVRQQILTRGGFELTLAPRGAIYVRGTDGGRLGAVLAPQYSWGNNLAILNLTWTAGISISPANPRSDYLTSFDYYRTLQKRGTAVFLGFQQELAAGVETANLEETARWNSRRASSISTPVLRRNSRHASSSTGASFSSVNNVLPAHTAEWQQCDILTRHRKYGEKVMPKKTFARRLPVICLPALCLALASSCLAQSPTAHLSIQADQQVSPVSPTLYGLMTEEINFSYDGGLYAEMVRNRTFRSDWSGILYWYLLENGDAAAKVETDKATGPSDALKTSLRLSVEKASAGNEAGVLNVGYWGMAVHANTEYKGSFYAKASADMGPVTVSLVSDESGKAAATTTVSGLTDEWKQYEFTLKTGGVATSAANHLALSVSHPGTLWLNLVSLFPPTYHNRVNGNRIDLMEKLAAMHPKFLRFPGGNYLEGDHIATRFDWKKTIGPLVDRPTHPSPWNYHSTDGMGLLEFLEWCEDLNMNPVLAVYAGYSLEGEHVNPGADLEPYVQDALDEIEYVTGGADTKWGAIRIKDGHPAPFKLTYVEIGNEDEFDRSGSYEERYTQFYKAIKAKYPDLQLIATTHIKGMKPDVQDDHYYVRATQNFHDAAHYDKADRNGPKIFVGEWATREGAPTPDMGAALGDAAWMTGMERNSDLIVMASYAPLLVNVNPGGMQWETDLIGYDTMKSYGSPAYFAQVMFSSYLGDHTLGSKLEGGSPKFFYSITGDAKKHLYLKLVNGESVEQQVNVDLRGAKLASAAKLVTLSARDPQATNSIDRPDLVLPVETLLHNVNSHLRHTMPPYSIQVIEFQAE